MSRRPKQNVGRCGCIEEGGDEHKPIDKDSHHHATEAHQPVAEQRAREPAILLR
jgi:hypothetical protein